ncbi:MULTISPECIES: helix-turn-helix domain-containing protein [Flavobacterium]|uniref:Helix-turn-helix domain-containing protein n=1 Tax=Flavobacterium jumunjinense TaxID=998845 RepID=A0ABV5GUI9_9FLAO|nr:MULTISPECIES: helix-turn-helix domain-containing protein [Flavobacterium]
MEFKGRNGEFFWLTKIDNTVAENFGQKNESYLNILWNPFNDTNVTVDNVVYSLKKNEIMFLTELHAIESSTIEVLNSIQFNRQFYCLDNHDSEIGCKGILFFGTSQVPTIFLNEENDAAIALLWKVFQNELKASDELQGEMLQMLLKRFLILCTRIFKEQNKVRHVEETKMDIIRNFSFLVEVHYKSKHTVAEYAALMNKPAKSLTNLFSSHISKTPLQIIQERIVLEAKRMLLNTEITIKEITFELGFEDMPSFSRFFKNKIGISPKGYRDNNGVVNPIEK